jgi:hypothetical protein
MLVGFIVANVEIAFGSVFQVYTIVKLIIKRKNKVGPKDGTSKAGTTGGSHIYSK